MATIPTHYDLERVAVELAKFKDSFDRVTFEYPGVVHLYADGAVWVVGTANGPMGADYYETVDGLINGESPNKSLEIDSVIRLTPDAIAAEIVDAIVTR